MKKSLLTQKTLLRRGGIFSRTTRNLLAGAGMLGVAASLTSCGESVTTYTEEDMNMARIADEVRRVDESASQLETGVVENNFHIEGLGYYHAGARNFFEHPYQHRGSDGRYFVDGQWMSEPGPGYVAPSRPTTEALEKTQQVLAAAQQQEAAAGTTSGGSTANVQQSQSSGFGMGNMLLMYMLLSGNRGMFNQGAAFQQAQQQAPKWQQGVNQQRAAVQSHANANPKFREMVNKRSSMGVGTGSSSSSIRGGMGSTGSRSGGAPASGGRS